MHTVYYTPNIDWSQVSVLATGTARTYLHSCTVLKHVFDLIIAIAGAIVGPHQGVGPLICDRWGGVRALWSSVQGHDYAIWKLTPRHTHDISFKHVIDRARDAG